MIDVYVTLSLEFLGKSLISKCLILAKSAYYYFVHCAEPHFTIICLVIVMSNLMEGQLSRRMAVVVTTTLLLCAVHQKASTPLTSTHMVVNQ